MTSASMVAVWGKRPIAASIATDLPDPDSPTIASTSLRSTEMSTASTALNAPLRVAKDTVRLRISSRGMGGLDGGRDVSCLNGFPRGRRRQNRVAVGNCGGVEIRLPLGAVVSRDGHITRSANLN